MPDRNVPGILGRSIGVALTAALRAEVMLVYIGAQRHGITLRIAHVDPSFDHPSRGPFDGQYMQALYEGRRRGRQEGHCVRRHPARAVDARIRRPAITAAHAASLADDVPALLRPLLYDDRGAVMRTAKRHASQNITK